MRLVDKKKFTLDSTIDLLGNELQVYHQAFAMFEHSTLLDSGHIINKARARLDCLHDFYSKWLEEKTILI